MFKFRGFLGERNRTKTHLKLLLSQASTHAGIDQVTRLRKEIDELDKTYRDMPSWKERELKALRFKAYDRQLEVHLDRFPIKSAVIANIGLSRKATLASWGIESAADVSLTKIQSLKGFGPALASEIVAWRRMHESSFKFDSSKAITQQDLIQVNQRYQQRLLSLNQNLLSTVRKLAQAQRVAQGKVAEVKAAIDKTATIFAQAREDVRVVQALLATVN